MALTEIMGVVGQLGGLAALGMMGRSALMFVVDRRSKVQTTKTAKETGEVDALSKLLQATPGEVVRLHERLAASEARADALDTQLKAAREQVTSLENLMAQVNIQLSNALMEISRMRQKERGTD